jgi:transcriptional regulator
VFHKKPKSSVAGEIMPGTLDMLILKVASRGAQHGYAIAQAIQSTSEDVLRVEEGALYPALHRLEVSGLLVAEWGVSDNNRRAKYYKLTPAGRRQLVKEARYWARLSAGIARVMETAS